MTVTLSAGPEEGACCLLIRLCPAVEWALRHHFWDQGKALKAVSLSGWPHHRGHSGLHLTQAELHAAGGMCKRPHMAAINRNMRVGHHPGAC